MRTANLLIVLTTLAGLGFLWQRGTIFDNSFSVFETDFQNLPLNPSEVLSDSLNSADVRYEEDRNIEESKTLNFQSWSSSAQPVSESVPTSATMSTQESHGEASTESLPAPSPPANISQLQPLSSVYRPPVLAEESADMYEMLPDSYLPEYKSFCWHDHLQKLQCMPSVYLAGMPKCGTTDLFEKLMWHTEMTRTNHKHRRLYNTPNQEKEFHYWTRTRIGLAGFFMDKSKRPRIKFRDFLYGTGAEQLLTNRELRITDGTPSLFWNQEGWEKRYSDYQDPPYTNAEMIYSITPDAKIIVIFRNPTKRLLSEYLYFWSNKKERRTPETFHREVVEEVNKFNTCKDTKPFNHCCHTDAHSQRVRVALGIYICYFKEWREVFKGNLLAVTLEEYKTEPFETLVRIYDHIGLSEPDSEELKEYLGSAEVSNSLESETKSLFGEMLEETKTLLDEFYKPYNEELAQYTEDSKFLFL